MEPDFARSPTQGNGDCDRRLVDFQTDKDSNRPFSPSFRSYRLEHDRRLSYMLATAAEKDIRLAGRPLGCAETHPDLDMLGYYPQAVSLFGLIDVLVMT